MIEEMDGQMNLFDPDSWCGKTSPVHSAATKARTSEPFSKRRQGLRTVVPLFLDLRKENGLLREPSWEMGGPLLGEYSMPSFGESPRDAVESHLSQILEENAHPKYYLSAKACQGILRRAEKRGKELPPILKTALIAQSAFRNELGSLGVKESLSSTTESAHSQPSTINECYPINTMIGTRGNRLGERTGLGIDDEGKPGYTISAAHSHAVCYVVSSYESNAMKSSNPHSGIYEAETARTLDNNGGSPACNQGSMVVVAIENHPADSRVKLSEDNCVQTLSSRMGTGGGNTPMVLSIDRAAYNQGQNAQYDFSVDGSGKSQTIVSKGPNAVCIGNGQPDQLGMSEKCGALNCMHDQQAIMAYSLQGSMIGRVEKNGPQGDGVNKDRSFTLNSTDRHAVTDAAVVRRLTPLECERLQGFPSGWTDIGDWTDSRGKTRKCTDTARYKALGNSIALPPWTYVLTRLDAYCKEHTMASLFDGIGGFPLIWERLNGKGSVVWASEVEEFPIAVTKTRFGRE